MVAALAEHGSGPLSPFTARLELGCEAAVLTDDVGVSLGYAGYRHLAGHLRQDSCHPLICSAGVLRPTNAFLQVMAAARPVRAVLGI